MIRKETRDKIVTQALKEIDFSRTYKQKYVSKWRKNENLYYSFKSISEKYDNKDIGSQAVVESRSNVDIGGMFGHIETILSKIDSPLTFTYKRGSIADLKKAKLLNALKERDADLDDWDWKDLLGKQQALLYGRAIFSYHAESDKGYRSYLENVDVYDFLIDPAVGGDDLDNALFMGRYGVKKNKKQLKEGVKKKDYIKSEVDPLIRGAGNYGSNTSQEDINKENRLNYNGDKVLENPDIYKFWEWYTTYEGERYYLLLTEEGRRAIRCEKLTDLFKEDEVLKDAMWPFWSWAIIPDLTEFWIPSKADRVREIIMAQVVSINQMLDNAERINKPQRAVDISKIENLADLVYRRNGIIRFKSGADINQVFKTVETPAINTPLMVYDKLESIKATESGVTPDSKGLSQEDKVGIYEGNLQQIGDRFGLLNKSYAQGYKRFAKLYWYGIEDHLSKKVAVKILGPKGLEKTVFVNRRDIKPYSNYDIMIESSNAEAQSDVIDKRNKINFLAQYKNNPIINQKVLFESEADIIGLSKDLTRSLLDVEDDGTAEIISEAERDIEDLLNKKIIEPNMNANVSYARYFIDYLKDHMEDMPDDTFLLFQDYLERLEPVIMRNMGSQLSNQLAKQGQMDQLQGGQPGGRPGIPPEMEQYEEQSLPEQPPVEEEII